MCWWTWCWWNCHWCQHGLAVAPRDVVDATKSHLQCLDPLQRGLVSWSTLYPVDKVPVPTRLDLDATTLLKMLKTLPMMMKALVMIPKPLWTMEKPFIGWRNINDPFCGHLWLNEVMKPTHLVVCWYSAHKINGGTLISPCSYGWFKNPTHMMIKPLKMSWILYDGCWRSTWFMKNILKVSLKPLNMVPWVFDGTRPSWS